jgi:hypothetical protein
MEKQPDGTWRIIVDLEPGEYQYKFFINGKWPQDMSTTQASSPSNAEGSRGCKSLVIIAIFMIINFY